MSLPTAAQPRSIFAPGLAAVSVALLALVTVVAFEVMAVSTAMPDVARELGLVRAYGLAFSTMLTAQLLGTVLAGVWSDRAGPMPSVLVGQALFVVGCTLCALAGGAAVFLLGRVVAGLGGGLLVVALYVVVGRLYPEALRGKVFTAISAAWVLPSLLGPLVAAWLTSTWSWRWVFWIVVLPVLVALVVIHRRRSLLDDASAQVGPASRDRRAHARAAWAGAVIALGAGILQWGTHEMDPEWTLRTGLAAAGLLLVAIAVPTVLPAGIYVLRRGVAAVVAARLLMPAAYFGMLTFVPLMLTTTRGASLTTAGVLLALGSLGWSFGAWLQGREQADGRRHLLVALGGASLVTALVLESAFAHLGWPVPVLAGPLVLAGLGQGLTTSSTSVLALDHTPVSDHGEAATALSLGDVLGSVLGISGATAVHAVASGAAGGDAPASSYGTIWLALALVAALVVPAGLRSRVPSADDTDQRVST